MQGPRLWNNLGLPLVLVCATGISLPVLFLIVENRLSSRQQSDCFRAEQETWTEEIHETCNAICTSNSWEDRYCWCASPQPYTWIWWNWSSVKKYCLLRKYARCTYETILIVSIGRSFLQLFVCCNLPSMNFCICVHSSLFSYYAFGIWDRGIRRWGFY